MFEHQWHPTVLFFSCFTAAHFWYVSWISSFPSSVCVLSCCRQGSSLVLLFPIGTPSSSAMEIRQVPRCPQPPIPTRSLDLFWALQTVQFYCLLATSVEHGLIVFPNFAIQLMATPIFQWLGPKTVGLSFILFLSEKFFRFCLQGIFMI